MKKMYSAFVSSVYTSLLDERAVVIKTMLDANVFPICMERFTVSETRQFADIADFILNSDFFVLMLGNDYGSIDPTDGLSWTQKEYEFAKTNNRDIFVLKMPDWFELEQRYKTDKSSLKEEDIKQVEFGLQIGMAYAPKTYDDIKKYLSNYLNGRIRDYGDEYIGWVRRTPQEEAEELARKLKPAVEKELERRAQAKAEKEAEAEREWQREHAHLNLAGTYYHIHHIPHNLKYLRSGTIEITQNFNSREYHKLIVKGHNHPTSFLLETKELRPSETKCTIWSAEYYLDENGSIKNGVYSAEKSDFGEFGGKTVRPGVRQGLHDFTVYNNRSDGLVMSGHFHDAVDFDESNGGKAGAILVFRDEQARFEYMAKDEDLAQVLLNNQPVKLF